MESRIYKKRAKGDAVPTRFTLIGGQVRSKITFSAGPINIDIHATTEELIAIRDRINETLKTAKGVTK